MAFVILHPQHASKWTGRHEEFAKDLISHARKTLPGFACPEWVQIVPELPVSMCSFIHGSQRVENISKQKTSTGKILKTELRKVVAKL